MTLTGVSFDFLGKSTVTLPQPWFAIGFNNFWPHIDTTTPPFRPLIYYFIPKHCYCADAIMIHCIIIESIFGRASFAPSYAHSLFIATRFLGRDVNFARFSLQL